MNKEYFEGGAYLCSLGCGTLLRRLKSNDVVEVEKSTTDLDNSSNIIAVKHRCRMLESKPTMSKLLFGNTYDLIEERTKDLESGRYIWPNRC